MIPRPRSVQFEINIRARLPRGRAITSAVAGEVVRHWIEDASDIPDGWRVRVVIWSDKKKREIDELDGSERGEILRDVLRRALQGGRLTIKTLRAHRT